MLARPLAMKAAPAGSAGELPVLRRLLAGEMVGVVVGAGMVAAAGAFEKALLVLLAVARGLAVLWEAAGCAWGDPGCGCGRPTAAL
jgi:hypothetical protein